MTEIVPISPAGSVVNSSYLNICHTFHAYYRPSRVAALKTPSSSLCQRNDDVVSDVALCSDVTGWVVGVGMGSFSGRSSTEMTAFFFK